MVSLLKKSGQSFESVVHGKSMEPTLPDGAAIEIGPLEPAGLRVGQIVVCANAHKLIAHRIVYSGTGARERSLVLTQGDGCLLCDPPIRKDAIQGVVTAIRIDGRWQEPAAIWVRRSWRQIVAKTHVYLMRTCLAVDWRFARFVARGLIVIAAVPRRFRN
jgi:hypothetical protein